MNKGKNKSYRLDDFDKGKKFVAEPTGSATQVNVDGKWEQDFYDTNQKKDRSMGTGDNPLAE
ncbi:LAS seventeen-binding protein 3 [Desulforamulus ferrireducens]|uniref:LAS seventeen-binding protein 3 n=1 Tax=Desulforamulus ferrireducens TaxID=1833852 RepID=A0A1S6IWF6_9FIRM|nr:LAS seventeen-binding protein 3 [Desulforamulus ferrireducens]AQS59117.1 LAS seventeen-binding protein 3 [Desulforamulus ferrireducens]